MNLKERSALDEKLGLSRDAPFPAIAASKCAACKEFQDLLKPQLSKALLRAFQNSTGASLHVLWHDPSKFARSHDALVLCPRAVLLQRTDGRIAAQCHDCLRSYWNPGVPANKDRIRSFKGNCRSTNLWASLWVGDAGPLLTLAIQTLPGRARVRWPASQIIQSARSCQRNPMSRRSIPRTDHLNSSASWLRLILHDLETTIHAYVTQRELEIAQLQLADRRSENSRLPQKLGRSLPSIMVPSATLEVRSRSHQIVQRMLDYVNAHYHHPMHLGDVAAALKRNKCYLSGLFSQTLGLRFHEYLEGMRLQKAKEFLGDPTSLSCEVAMAVGYRDAGHFWRVFKGHTGLSPSLWRVGKRRPQAATARGELSGSKEPSLRKPGGVRESGSSAM